ncbi:MAG: nucleotidyltransferase domain-containing protein [Chloroflexi bacterium]|nr:nucleotidyltransferase domain-containing protein [Chloroflexota bacterium]
MVTETLGIRDESIVGQRDSRAGAASTLEANRFIGYWRQRQTEQRALSQQLAQQAREEALQIAAMLRQRYRATRVILFGSLAQGRFTPGSDIDLAIEGLAPADFFPALAQANEFSNSWVDLKPLEDLEPHFRTRVLATGEDL